MVLADLEPAVLTELERVLVLADLEQAVLMVQEQALALADLAAQVQAVSVLAAHLVPESAVQDSQSQPDLVLRAAWEQSRH